MGTRKRRTASNKQLNLTVEGGWGGEDGGIRKRAGVRGRKDGTVVV
jgi:hypothetical protein